jgi:hypothetical protein
MLTIMGRILQASILSFKPSYNGESNRRGSFAFKAIFSTDLKKGSPYFHLALQLYTSKVDKSYK